MASLLAILAWGLVGFGGTGIRGRVVDDRGEPVPRFLVETRRVDDAKHDFWGPTRAERRRAARAFSGDGSFELPKLDSGSWVVTVLGAGDTESALQVVNWTDASGELHFVLPRPARLTGVVVDGSAAPIAHASIFVAYPGERLDGFHGRGPSNPPRTHADANGRFELTGLNPRTVLLAATDEARAESDWMKVVIEPDASAEATLRLHVGARIIGTIDPSLGAPAGRQVDLFSFNGLSGWRTTLSDADGRFAIENVIPQDYVIELRPPGYPNLDAEDAADGSPQAVEKRDPPIPSVRRNIEVAEKQTVTVRFARSSVAIPVVGRVTIEGVPAAGIELRPYPLEGQDDLGKRIATDDAGRYALSLPARGRWRFSWSKGWGSHAHFERSIEAPQEGATEGVELDFDLPGGVVSGVVRSPAGDPLAHVPLTLLREPVEGEDPRQSFWARYERENSDEEGRFEFSLLPPGRYSLRAVDGLCFSSPAPRMPWGRVVIPDLRIASRPLEPLTVVVAEEGSLHGRVVDGAGKPVEGVALQVVDARGVALMGFAEVKSDGTGGFVLPSLPPGSCTVVATKGRLEARSTPVVVEAGKSVGLSIAMQ